VAGREGLGLLAGATGFELRRSVLVLYGLLAVALSAVLLSLSLHRGPGELRRWLAAYVAVGVLSIVRPGLAPLAGGASAFLLGFVRTHQGGFNLDLGLGLVALSVGAWVLWRARRGEGREPVDLAGLALLLLAAWSSVSLAFVFARVRSFRPAPAFDYHAYQWNAFGLSSEEALVRAAIGATAAFLSFGLYLYGRHSGLDRRTLGAAVFLVLLANGAALLVQRHDPDFLRPAGAIPPGRLNGMTSFCYALGDAALALFLLLPAWGAARGPGRARTAGSLVLLLQAAVASGSRTALLGMLAAALLWGWVLAVRRFRGRGALASLAATALLLWAGSALYRATPPDQATPLGRLRYGVETEGILGHLVEQRLHSYPLAFRVMGEYPLSGIGAGLYPAEVSKQRALLAPDLKVLDYLLTSYAPSQFLNVGVELGLPALAALLAAFAAVALSLLRRGGLGAAEWLVSLAVLAAALQLGPAFYNSEALVFGWLVLGLAARAEAAADASGEAPPAPTTVVARATSVLLSALVAAALAGHALSAPALSVEHQWRRLRWRLGMGMLAPEGEGRWTRSQATFSIDTPAPAVRVEWHAGDPAFPAYRADVSFYVDGVLVERSAAASGRRRQSLLPLPKAAGFKRISVRVEPPFIPAEHGGKDERRLGIFVHSVTRGRPQAPEGS
jgi:hypothetical protein